MRCPQPIAFQQFWNFGKTFSWYRHIICHHGWPTNPEFGIFCPGYWTGRSWENLEFDNIYIASLQNRESLRRPLAGQDGWSVLPSQGFFVSWDSLCSTHPRRQRTPGLAGRMMTLPLEISAPRPAHCIHWRVGTEVWIPAYWEKAFSAHQKKSGWLFIWGVVVVVVVVVVLVCARRIGTRTNMSETELTPW